VTAVRSLCVVRRSCYPRESGDLELGFGVAPAQEQKASETHAHKEHGAGLGNFTAAIVPVGGIVAEWVSCNSIGDGRIPAEVEGLHNHALEGCCAVDCVVGEGETSVDVVLVCGSRELHFQAIPITEDNGVREVDPSNVVPHPERGCSPVVGKANNGVVGNSDSVGHDCPHVGAPRAVAFVSPFNGDIEIGSKNVANSSHERELPALGVVERGLVWSGPVVEGLRIVDFDAQHVRPSGKWADVRERVGIVPVHNPSDGYRIEIRYDIPGVGREGRNGRENQENEKSLHDTSVMSVGTTPLLALPKNLKQSFLPN